MAYLAADQKDRWKAMAGAIAVTSILGAGILTGLNVRIVGNAFESPRTFDITLPKLPPLEPPPREQPKQAKTDEGAPAAPKASPIVAPKPKVKLPTKQVIAAAAQAGSGNSSSNGQGGIGTGTGAGGSGNGLGDGGGITPARLVRNLSRSDYWRLTGGRLAAGSAGLAIGVDTRGRVHSCVVEHSSGDAVIDSGLCPLVAARLRFRPALDSSGRRIRFYTHYLATWRR